MYGLNPLQITGRRVGQVFVGQLGSEPFPFEIFRPVWPAMGVGPGPKVPTQFSYFLNEMIFFFIKKLLPKQIRMFWFEKGFLFLII